MKITLAVLVALCCTAVVFGAASSKIQAHPKAAMWNQWMLNFNKRYESEVEEVVRFRIWAESLKQVEEHNAAYDLGLTTFTLAMNEFADLTGEEFAAQRLGYKKGEENKAANLYQPSANVEVPSSVDWTSQGYVTPVKNQGQCGSCWAFSTTGSLEGQHYRATGQLISLSEQELVDCDSYCYGCNGGWVQKGFEYIRQHGITSESSYAYTARQGYCSANSKPVYATLSTYYNVQQGSESALHQALGTVGPVSIAIDASQRSFQLYNSGVYYEPNCSSSSLDHAVLATGYGHDSSAGMDYWTVKNSWGSSWGENGYIRMARNMGNNCGVATDATYPAV